MRNPNLLNFYLAAYYFFFFAYVGVIIIFLPKTLYDMGYSAYEIGIVFGIIPLTRFLIPFLFIRHVRLTSRMFTFSVWLFLFSAALFYFTIHDLYWLCFSHFLMGIAVSLIPPYVESLALHELKKENYGRIRLYGSLGFIVVAYVLADFIGSYENVLHCLMLTVMGSLIFSLLLIPYGKEEAQEEESESLEKDIPSFSLKAHWALWVSIILMQVGFGGFYNFFTIYESENGFSIDLIKYMWMFGVLCEVAMLYWQRPLLKQVNLLTLIKFTVYITVLRWILLYQFPESASVSFFSQSFHALSFALYHTATISYLHAVYREKRLAQQFYSGFCYGLGMFLGAHVSGAVYGPYLFAVCAGITLLGGVVLAWEGKRAGETLRIIKS